MPQYAENPTTGERLVLDKGSWIPVQHAYNEQTGEHLEFFNDKWVAPHPSYKGYSKQSAAAPAPKPQEQNIDEMTPPGPRLMPGSPIVESAEYPEIPRVTYHERRDLPLIMRMSLPGSVLGPIYDVVRKYSKEKRVMPKEEFLKKAEKYQERMAQYMDVEQKMASGDFANVPTSQKVFYTKKNEDPRALSQKTFRFVVGDNDDVYYRGEKLDKEILRTVAPDAYGAALGGQLFVEAGPAVMSEEDRQRERRAMIEAGRPQGFWDVGRKVLDKKTGKLVKAPTSIEDVMTRYMRLAVEEPLVGATGSLADMGVFGAGVVHSEKGVRFFKDFRMKSPTPKEYQGLAEEFAQSAGSMAPFMGMGKIAQGLSKAGPAGRWFAAGIMGASEAAAEAGNVYAEATDEGWTPEKARKAMWGTFLANVGVNTALDKVGVLNEGAGKWLTRVAKAAPAEATQEAFQQVIQNLALKRPWDEGVDKAFFMGGVIGAGAKGIESRFRGAKLKRITEGRRGRDIEIIQRAAEAASETMPEIQAGEEADLAARQELMRNTLAAYRERARGDKQAAMQQVATDPEALAALEEVAAPGTPIGERIEAIPEPGPVNEVRQKIDSMIEERDILIQEGSPESINLANEINRQISKMEQAWLRGEAERQRLQQEVPSAAEEGQVTEGGIGERQGVDEVGTAPETGRGDLAEAGGIVQEEAAKVEPVSIRTKDGVRFKFDNANDVRQVESMRKTLDAMITDIKGQPMTSEERKAKIANAVSQYDSVIKDLAKSAEERKLSEEVSGGQEVVGLHGEAGKRPAGEPGRGRTGAPAHGTATTGEVEEVLSRARSHAVTTEESSHGYRPVADFIDGNRELAKTFTTQDNRKVTYTNDGTSVHAMIDSGNGAPTAVVLTIPDPSIGGLENSVMVDDLYKADIARGKGEASSDYKAIVELARQINPQADSLAGFAIGDGSFGHRITYPNTEMVNENTPFLLKTPFSDIESGVRHAMSKEARSSLMDDMRGGLTTQEARVRLEDMRKPPRDVASMLGGQELYEMAMKKLGLNPDANVQEIVTYVTSRIGSLGKTVQETAIKIMGKIKNIGREVANALAKMLHEINPFQGRQGEIGTIGKIEPWTPKVVTNSNNPIVGKSIPSTQDVDNAVTSGISEIATINAGDVPKGVDPKLLMGYGKKLPRAHKSFRIFGKEFTPLLWVESPTVAAMGSSGLQNVNTEVNRYVGKIENILQTFNDSLQSMASLKFDRRVALTKALAFGTLANEGKGGTWSDTNLRDRFGLNDAEIEAYKTIRKQMESVRKLLIQSERSVYMRQRDKAIASMNAAKTEDAKGNIRNNINELDEAFMKLVNNLGNEAYFPLMRFGNFKIELLDKATGERIGSAFVDSTKDVDVTNALSLMTLEDDRARIAIENNNFEVKTTELPKLDFLKNAGGAIFDPAFMRYLTAAQKIDPDVMTQIELSAANAYLQDTWKNHMQHRTGLPGYSLDGLKVMQTFARTAANRIANNEHGHAMTEALGKMGQEALGDKYDSVMEAEGRRIVDSARNPPYHPVANTLTNLSFISFMGLRIGFAVTNLTQQGTMGVPVLASAYKMHDVVSALAKANWIAKDLVLETGFLSGLESFNEAKLTEAIDKAVTEERLKKWGKNKEEVANLTKLVKSVLHSAVRDGELRAKVADELMSQKDRATTAGKGASVLDKVGEATGVFASKSEMQNRITTMIAYTMLANKSGRMIIDENGLRLGSKMVNAEDNTSAREAAEVVNRIINFCSGRGNLSPYQRVGGAGGGMLRVATQYKRFFIDSVTTLHELGKAHYKTKKALNANQFSQYLAYAKPQVMSYSIAMMLGGASAAPFWLIFKALLKLWYGDDYAPFIAETRQKAEGIVKSGLGSAGFEGDRDRMAKHLVFLAENGLPNATGINMNAALTANMIPGRDNATGAETFGRMVAGPSVGKVLDIYDELANGELDSADTYLNALQKASPLGVNNIIQAVGGKAKFGGRGIEMTATERGLKGASFTPTRVSKIHQQRGEEVQISMAKKDLVKSLSNIYKNASDESKDDVRQKTIIPRVEKWNDRMQRIGHEKQSIMPSQIIGPSRKEEAYKSQTMERAMVEDKE